MGRADHFENYFYPPNETEVVHDFQFNIYSFNMHNLLPKIEVWVIKQLGVSCHRSRRTLPRSALHLRFRESSGTIPIRPTFRGAIDATAHTVASRRGRHRLSQSFGEQCPARLNGRRLGDSIV